MSEGEMSQGAMSWRVMTWNVLGARHPDLGALAAAIDARHPDVVALQEVRASQASGLAQRLGMHVTWARKHYPYSPLLWWTAEGMALLAQEPLTDVVRFTVTPGVSTWSYRHRVVLAATAQAPTGERLRVYDIHLSPDSADRRIAQAQMIGQRASADPPPVVIAGDLNVHDDTVEVLRELKVAGVTDPGGDATSPSIAPVRRLDYVLVPAGATVVATETPPGGQEWHELSDHLPATVGFRPTVW